MRWSFSIRSYHVGIMTTPYARTPSPPLPHMNVNVDVTYLMGHAKSWNEIEIGMHFVYY